MFSLQHHPTRLCDGITRRQWLQVGGLGALGISLPQLLENRATLATATGGSSSFGRAKRCIVLFLLGGPPQHETWDPKADAPEEVRGEFGLTSTETPGLNIGELMPKIAHQTNHIAVLRAVSTDDNAHSSSGYWMLTGRPHAPRNSENSLPGPPNDWPCVGAVVRQLRGDQGHLPGAIRLPEEIWNTGRLVWPGQDAGWLGDSADPWLMTCDPNANDFQAPDIGLPGDISPLRFDRRRALFAAVNQHLDQIARSSAVSRWQSLRQKGFDLIGSPAARQAFDLHREPAALRDRYGRNRFGQSVLLARRLIESGVNLVQVNWTRWDEDTSEAPAWDTHAHHNQRLKNALMPPMDSAYATLLEDLHERGLLEETLVVWMGEFGRTPRFNPRGGRDHWGHVFPVALAGGGIRGGVVHGASDRQGAFPLEGRVEPQDIAATIFHCLGFAPETMVHDRQGRPQSISHGRPIEAIL
jgi:hypothetical protein